jgi:hypothetical protein
VITTLHDSIRSLYIYPCFRPRLYHARLGFPVPPLVNFLFSSHLILITVLFLVDTRLRGFGFLGWRIPNNRNAFYFLCSLLPYRTGAGFLFYFPFRQRLLLIPLSCSFMYVSFFLFLLSFIPFVHAPVLFFFFSIKLSVLMLHIYLLTVSVFLSLIFSSLLDFFLFIATMPWVIGDLAYLGKITMNRSLGQVTTLF